MTDFAPIDVLGRRLSVKLERRRIRNAYARVRPDCVVIELPMHMGIIRSRSVADLLYKRIRRSIEKNPNRYAEIKELNFTDGQTLRVLDRAFVVKVDRPPNSRRTASSLDLDAITVSVPAAYPKERADSIVTKKVIGIASAEMLPELERRIAYFNDRHFHSVIPSIAIRDTTKVMGSCAPDNSIMISFRMLCADPPMLDYIIVHELAHTRFKNHSKMFWALVSFVIPDYRQRRRWLRNNLSVVSVG